MRISLNDLTWYGRLYWKWRLSPFSIPYYIIKTFFFLQWNARRNAVLLEDCMKVFGSQTRHTTQHKVTCKQCQTEHVVDCNPDDRLISKKTIDKFYERTYWSNNNPLPDGWRWRKD